MLHIIFTLDYEIHGNGEGRPQKLMVEPTERLLRLFDHYGAKLTIMADVAEIMKFEEYKKEYGRDDYWHGPIQDQLRRAVRNGHDVQLHIHPSYFQARHHSGRWQQDWTRYDFAGLNYEEMDRMVAECKSYLSDLLKKEYPTYDCIAFRAANWSVNPSPNVIRTLINNKILIDSSVFKYGRRKGIVNFDYSNAHSDIFPWKVDDLDICSHNPNGRLWEFPIYSEKKSVLSFLTLLRMGRVLTSFRHPIRSRLDHSGTQASMPKKVVEGIKLLSRKQTWKADFNQCTGRQLIRTIQALHNRYSGITTDFPFVMIGHSKLLNRFNLKSLQPLLRFINDHQDQYIFSTFTYYKSKLHSQTNFTQRT